MRVRWRYWRDSPLPLLGTLETLWFALMMALNLVVPIAPGIFFPLPPDVLALTAIAALIVGVVGVVTPGPGGALAVAFICVIRSLQSVQLHSAYPIGVWAIIAAVAVGVGRRRTD